MFLSSSVQVCAQTAAILQHLVVFFSPSMKSCDSASNLATTACLKKINIQTLTKRKKLSVANFRLPSVISSNVSVYRSFTISFLSFSDLSKCCFRPPLPEPQECQVFCSLPTHYATRVALHTGTVLV